MKSIPDSTSSQFCGFCNVHSLTRPMLIKIARHVFHFYHRPDQLSPKASSLLLLPFSKPNSVSPALKTVIHAGVFCEPCGLRLHLLHHTLLLPFPSAPFSPSAPTIPLVLILFLLLIKTARPSAFPGPDASC
jgi:hypothetical protein